MLGPTLKKGMTMKKLAMAITSFAAVLTALATDYTWTGNSLDKKWTTEANWSPNGVPGETDTATFNEDVVLDNAEREIMVGSLVLNANLTHRFNQWLTIGGISGTGELVLKNRGYVRNISGVPVTCANDIRIAETDFTDCSNHSAAPYIQGNGANFTVTGKLLGDGDVFLTMSGYFGVHLAGDNSEFTGTVHVDQNGSNRMKFDAAQAGLNNGTLILHGKTTDNGSLTFENGTIEFGALRTPDYGTGALFRSISKHNTLIIGGLNGENGDSGEEDRLTLGMGDDENAYAKIVKIGTGTLELGPTRHREGTILSNGTVRVTHSDGIAHKDSAVTFDGGTLEYGEHDGVAVTKDISACVKNSTGFISVDTGTNDIVWANKQLTRNNPDMKGIVKKGEGELRFDSYDDLVLAVLKSNAYTNRIDGGTLTFRNSRRGQRPDLMSKILGTGTLRFVDFEDNGSFRLRGNGALEEFAGTVEWANEIDQSSSVGFMITDNINIEWPHLKFRVTGDPAECVSVMQGETAWNPATAHVTLGAFDHLHPNAAITFDRSAWTLNILGTAGDSYLNGTFSNQCVNVVKTGVGKLTVGPGLSAPEGSLLNVKEGEFAWNRTTELSGIGMTLADDLILSGTGTLAVSHLPSTFKFATAEEGETVLTIDGPLSLAGATVVFDPATADKSKTYPVVNATSFTGSATLTDDGNDGKGRWKLLSRTVEGKRQIYAMWTKNALVISIR